LSSNDAKEANSLEGYRGIAFNLLANAKATIGSRIKVLTADGFETVGLLISRYLHADEKHIVLKLKSGYNIGIDASNVIAISIVDRPKPPLEAPFSPIQSKSGKKVLLLSTGGTIASRVDYRTGAVHPALSAEDLYSAVPELGEIAEIRPEVVFSTYSENLNPTHWQKLAERIAASDIDSSLDGIVVMLGTDTMAYVSAALSFSLIGFSLPIVCVGAQRSSDRPSSDSALNLKAAVRFAAYAKSSGVYLAMHKDISDDAVAIHSGTRVRKNHTSRRDAFESIDVPLVAEVRGTEIVFLTNPKLLESNQVDESLKTKTKFEPRVALLKFYPGFQDGVLDYLLESNLRGIVFEGSGLGHVSSQTVSKISKLTQAGLFVGITSQCIWGRVDLNVYDTGRDLLNAGATSLQDTLGETAFAKLSWALGNFPKEKVEKVMQTNLIGEMTTRTAP
jgi:glutamyl-tRNA(Gln) amidotransferase subunit D